jgi:hypothetical protein
MQMSGQYQKSETQRLSDFLEAMRSMAAPKVFFMTTHLPAAGLNVSGKPTGCQMSAIDPKPTFKYWVMDRGRQGNG